MDDDLKLFENYLHEFRPREPRLLHEPMVPVARASGLRRFAAAAVVVLACTATVWFASRGHTGETSRDNIVYEVARHEQLRRISKPSARALARLAVEHPDRLDLIFTQSPRTELPRFDKSGSALSVLAKE
jgi:hypothetical protein